MKYFRPLTVLSVSVMLVAGLGGCSDSGDDRGVGSDVVDFSVPSRASALAEIAQLRYLITPWGTPFSRPLQIPSAQSPNVDCISGSVEVTESEKERPLVFYSHFETQVDATTWQFQDCVNTVTTDGALEKGVVQGSDPNAFDPIYGYEVFEAYRLEADGGVNTISGIREERSADDERRAASALVREVERGQEVGSHWVRLEQGTLDNPLRFYSMPDGTPLSIDGSWAWTSSMCSGGSREVSGSVDLTSGLFVPPADEWGYPVGGTLTLTADTAWMAIAFTPNGATVTFHDGTVIDLTADEITAALEEPIC